MGYCKKDVSPLLTHCSYIFHALTHRYKGQSSWQIETWTKLAAQGHSHFQTHYFWRKCVFLSPNFSEDCRQICWVELVSADVGNGLALYRWRAIVTSSDDKEYLWIIVSLGTTFIMPDQLDPCTVQYHYNVVNFLTTIHKRHPIARQLMWGMMWFFFCGSSMWLIFCLSSCNH